MRFGATLRRICDTPTALVKSVLPQLRYFAQLAVVFTVACTHSPPTASPRSDVKDVQVTRAPDKPDFVKLERDGDPTVGIAAAYIHGASTLVSRAMATAALAKLRDAGYLATVRPTSAGVIVSLSLTRDSRLNGAVSAIQTALDAGFTARKQLLTSPPPSNLAPCGDDQGAGEPAAPGYANTVLAAVGDRAILEQLQSDYERNSAWAAGGALTVALPDADEYAASVGPFPAELTVSLRTPARERLVPAARIAGEPNSLLSLLARSHGGQWQLQSAGAHFTPRGGCISVRLAAGENVTPLHAARAAKAVQRELEWIVAEQSRDEDPRFNVLEATSAEEAAQRAAWEAITGRNHDAAAPSTTYLAYRGPEADANAWVQAVEAHSEPAVLPQVSRDERGQGRVWAMLSSRCPVAGEDHSTAGHTAAALLAAAHADERVNVEPYITGEHLGLVAFQSTRVDGAEDRVAESLARSILQVLAKPNHLATQVVRHSQTTSLDSPTWTLALTLASNGHPSWLSHRSTPQSRALFDSDALEHAMRAFVTSPLQLGILSNQGAPQTERLNTRLSHLLSGVLARGAECPTLDTNQASGAAGEYDIDTSGNPEAVLLYVTDQKFSSAVRHLAFALNQPRGWLSRSITPLGARAVAVGLGTPSTLAALGITVSARDRDTMTRAIAQTRTLISQLAQATETSLPTPPDVPARTPVERLAALLHAPSTSDAPPQARSELDALVTRGLTERRLIVVRPLKYPASSSTPE